MVLASLPSIINIPFLFDHFFPAGAWTAYQYYRSPCHTPSPHPFLPGARVFKRATLLFFVSMAGPVESYTPTAESPFSNAWLQGESYAQQFRDLFPARSSLPIAGMRSRVPRFPKRRREVRRRYARKFRRGRRTRPSRAAKRAAPSFRRRLRRDNRGIGALIKKARNAYNTRLVYDSFSWDRVTASELNSKLSNFSCKISDFTKANELLSDATLTTTNQVYYTEYKVVKAFVKVRPVFSNLVRYDTSFGVANAHDPEAIGIIPYMHPKPADSTTTLAAKLRASRNVKWVPLRKVKGSQMPILPYVEEVITIKDELSGTSTTQTVHAPLKKMPFIEYVGGTAEQVAMMPFGVWYPKVNSANVKFAYDISIHAVFALRNNANDIAEM